MTKESSRREDRAQNVVENFGVKKHVFFPSGKALWTVVGREGDFLVDLNTGESGRDYCSCGDFHFRVLSGIVPECYHLMAARQALKLRKFTVIELSDEEFGPFLKLLLRDLFSHIT